MQWSEIQKAHPEAWLVLEAMQSHEDGNLFIVDDAAVAEVCTDGAAVLDSYRHLHRLYPARELLFVHTTRKDLKFEIRRWAGIRAGT